jgi:transcriptional regulator GlxA family with amidase domain
VPPSLDGYRPGESTAALATFIARRHDEGTVLCSACVGSFLLAEAGLLSGRPATTHWGLKEQFAARFPDVELDTDKLLIDDGDVITAGGMMAWVDLGLRLVGRFVGPAAVLATARYFLVDPGGREQRFYSVFSPSLTHGDAAVLKTQRWLQSKSGEKVTLSQMARQAALGERTFLRRFRAATGMKPTEYVQHLRVAKAREMIELTNESIEEITRRVGYEDVGSFRQVFQKIMGLSPGEYRRRFAARRS